MKKLSKEEFINRARKVHGDKYDYSKVKYDGYKTPLEIICPIHGEFKQTINNHLHGKGCKECGIITRSEKKRLSKEEFILKAREVHGWKYDYSKVEYEKTNKPICIICPEHGEFWQTPNKHISTKHGCPKCAKNGVKLTTEEFIQKAKKIYGNKYDYSKVNYINNQTPVYIICPEHGEFYQKPFNHLLYCGCPVCNQTNKITTEIFIKKAIDVHGNKYDYSKVNYINAEEKVCIICKKHGEFWQKAHHHLYGSGCPSCNERKLEKEMRLFLTEHNIKFEEQKTFDWLKNINNLRLDFYLPDYNIAIECQGAQHFEPVDFAGLGKEWAEKQFLLNQSRDRKKKELCEENGIKIIYYTEENKDNFKII